jgi:hypothetical protein
MGGVDTLAFILFAYPRLMRAVLDAAMHGTARVEDCLAGLPSGPAEEEGLTRAEALQRLECALLHLEKAQLIARRDADCYEITPRGRVVLVDHPDRIEEWQLMQFPEFREFARAAGPPTCARGESAYERGIRAYWDGSPHNDNPFPFDTLQHLAWDEGWFDARDEELAPNRP